MCLLLSRIDFQGDKTPLYLRDRPGSGIVVIKAAPGSDKVVKILAPWALEVFDPFRHKDDCNDLVSGETPVPIDVDDINLPDESPVDTSNSPEGSARNWPLIMQTWRQYFPDLLENISGLEPGTMEQSSKSDTVFNETSFFKQGLDWLHLLVNGCVSPSGRKTATASPFPRGKWLPHSVSRLRRFYKHGHFDHVNFTPSSKAASLLRADSRDSFETMFTRTPASYIKMQADSFSLLREVLSTSHNLSDIIKSDSTFQSCLAPSRAALVSLKLALKDAMSIASQLQANLLLLQRDRFVDAMQPSLLAAKPKVASSIRTASFSGPLVPK